MKRFAAVLLPLAGSLLLAAAPAAAQRIDGTLAGPRTRDLVAHAMIVMLDSAGAEVARTRTGRDGGFRLNVPAAGTYHLRAELQGAVIASGSVAVPEGAIVDVTMWVLPGPVAAAAERDSAIRLEPIEVVGEVERQRLTLAGYYERKRVTGGLFLSGSQFRARGGARVADALSGLRGVVARPLGATGFVLQQRRLGRPCNATLTVDGMRQPASVLSTIKPEDVEAVEVYSAGEVPLQFARVNRDDSVCGAVVLWLKAPVAHRP